jgi:selenide,water dikinase
VGFETSDDAGVFQLSEELALVQTVDFFTPIVDDPYWFGRIAAANALSDVYAMGGTPLTALNILCFPDKTLDLHVMSEILRGGAETALEAGVTIVGGHSVSDAEPKYGMAVTGTVHPARIIRNVGARVGDVLALSKPLGTGILCTAHKRGELPEEMLERVSQQMATLNRAASRVMLRLGAHAATDVTGFGLLGHALEVARGSGVCLELDAANIPLLEGARTYVEGGFVPGGGRNNARYVEQWLDDQVGDAVLSTLLSDPQTSGGLLMVLPPEAEASLEAVCQEEGVVAPIIGRVTALEGQTHLRIVP